MKTAKLTATFPEVLDTELSCEVTASTVRAAVARALGNILKSPELKRKRVKRIELVINLSNGE